MSDQYVEAAKANMNVFERLLKGLPGISGYVERELRRDADKRLRDVIANQLDEQRQAILSLQKRLLSSGGLTWLDDIDGAVQKLQLLIDRVRTASYGYAGLFNAVRIREEQLNALHSFDVALAGRVVAVENAVQALSTAVANKADVLAACEQLTNLLDELNHLFGKRQEAVLDPDLLMSSGFAPTVDLSSDTQG
jgi:outer membrane lipopolysaccharide assembly protein LptE/RlpB